jgi:hypothetical protein
MLILAAGTKAVAGADNYLVQRSLRFRSSATAYLSRTFSAGSQTTWTWSAWVKRGTIGSLGRLFGAGTINTDGFVFQAGDQFAFGTDSTGIGLITTQVFRDPSAWYHFVVVMDTTQATAANRVKIYVNGTQITSFSTATYPAQNSTSTLNSAVVHNIGRRLQTGAEYFDGYITELNFIDGQALTPSSFGATNADTGVWRAKAYTGTYGTNGYYLNFADNSALTTASNVGISKDNSGNGNYWVTNNISITTGTTYDSMTDVPTLTSATAGNYCVLNSLAGGGVSATDANLTLNQGSAAWTAISSTISVSLGKYYFEATASNPTAATPSGIGLTITRQLGTSEYVGSFASSSYGAVLSNIALNSYSNGSAGTAVAGTYTSANIMQCAVDLDAGKIWFGQNNNWIGGGNPSSGTTPTFTFTANTLLMPYFSSYSSSTYANFGQRPFINTSPSGFVALNTYNLPTSTIVQGNKWMDATTYTGTGASLSVTNAGAFKPDLVWMKGRSGATDHALYDSVRGTTIDLVSNSTAAETTQATGLTAFGTSGFTVGALAKLNTSTATYVGWQWRASNATGVSNTNGSITSTVSVNASAGFSIVTYTGNNTAGATVGHGLGVAPSMIIDKCRSSGVDGWVVYHKSIGATNILNLSSTIASTASAAWNNTTPTSTVFSLGGGGVGTNISGGSQLAYCWAEIAGFSKFGSYTGNGSTDGTFVYLGFRPRFVMVKNTSTAGTNWVIIDSSRDLYNLSTQQLRPNTNGAELTGTQVGNEPIDILSNGFKCRGQGTDGNGSANTIIYAAFAENPFKYSNAR